MTSKHTIEFFGAPDPSGRIKAYRYEGSRFRVAAIAAVLALLNRLPRWAKGPRLIRLVDWLFAA